MYFIHFLFNGYKVYFFLGCINKIYMITGIVQTKMIRIRIRAVNCSPYEKGLIPSL